MELTGEYHEDVNMLIQNIDELKAHCERLKSALASGVANEECSAWMLCPQEVDEAIRSAPTHSLADIQARAIEDEADHLESVFGSLHTSRECIDELNARANQLRKGEL